VTWQRMLSNIHQIPSLRIDATCYTYTVLDEGIAKKIQALNDQFTNGWAAPLFMNSQNAAAPLLVRTQLTTVSSHQELYRVFFETRATNSSNLESKSLRMGDWFDFL
jgi:hypothetical protein